MYERVFVWGLKVKDSSLLLNFFISDQKDENLAASLLNTEDSLEEVEKLAFVCSCAAESADAGGSTLITITRIGIVLQLLELMSNSLESSSLKVRFFFSFYYIIYLLEDMKNMKKVILR